jgi:hypothetical protein
VCFGGCRTLLSGAIDAVLDRDASQGKRRLWGRAGSLGGGEELDMVFSIR